jgi:glycine/D-amino acid oxidase-like deaminating enzyme/nitrite reductase/ring-hydroxylating ferredoxin subunit
MSPSNPDRSSLTSSPLTEENLSIWFNTAHATRPSLETNLEVQVVIVGAGLMGLTAALELARGGIRSVVLERRWVGAGETGHTTAHVTARPDVPMHELVKRLGRDEAAAVWGAMDAALRHIETRSEQLGTPFTRVDAWLLGKRNLLNAELEALLEVGASAVLETPPSPLPGKLGLRVRDQARFDVAQYLSALAHQAQQLGVEIYEQSAVVSSEGSRLHVVTPRGEFTVNADTVILATHVPVFANPLLLDRLRPDQSYAIAVAVPAGSAPDVLAEDDHDPYHYYRLERGASRGRAVEDIVIFGGEDHPTGSSADTEGHSRSLHSTLERWLPNVPMRLLRCWTGEIWTTADGLPIIGEDEHGRFFGTGFAGVGMTQATIAGLMAADWVRERHMRWEALFSPRRFSAAEVPGVLQRGATFVSELIRTHLPRRLPQADNLEPGQGEIVTSETGRAAAYRELSGELYLLDPKCSHAGCELRWNEADKTWDCGCHGSRFEALGAVRAGPATKAMARLEAEE